MKEALEVDGEHDADDGAPADAKNMMTFWTLAKIRMPKNDEHETDDVEERRDQEGRPGMVGEPVGSTGPAHELEGHGEARIHGQRRQHVDPHEPDDGVAEALRDTDDRVQDARVVDVLAARPRHGTAEDAHTSGKPMPAKMTEITVAQIRLAPRKVPTPRLTTTQMLGVRPWFMKADGESVPHREASYETAGFAGKG